MGHGVTWGNNSPNSETYLILILGRLGSTKKQNKTNKTKQKNKKKKNPKPKKKQQKSHKTPLCCSQLTKDLTARAV